MNAVDYQFTLTAWHRDGEGGRETERGEGERQREGRRERNRGRGGEADS